MLRKPHSGNRAKPVEQISSMFLNLKLRCVRVRARARDFGFIKTHPRLAAIQPRTEASRVRIKILVLSDSFSPSGLSPGRNRLKALADLHCARRIQLVYVRMLELQDEP